MDNKDDDDDDQADDITDVWDEERLKAALGELHEDRVSGPATASKRDQEASIEVTGGPSSPEARADTDPPPEPRPRGGGMSWPVTIGLAVILAITVYALVTLLK